MLLSWIVLKCLQNPDTGIAHWIVDERESDFKLPEYDGSDEQSVTINFIQETIVDEGDVKKAIEEHNIDVGE